MSEVAKKRAAARKAAAAASKVKENNDENNNKASTAAMAEGEVTAAKDQVRTSDAKKLQNSRVGLFLEHLWRQSV